MRKTPFYPNFDTNNEHIEGLKGLDMPAEGVAKRNPGAACEDIHSPERARQTIRTNGAISI